MAAPRRGVVVTLLATGLIMAAGRSPTRCAANPGISSRLFRAPLRALNVRLGSLKRISTKTVFWDGIPDKKSHKIGTTAGRNPIHIEHVEPNSPNANKTKLFGSEDELKALLKPITPINDVPDSQLGSVALVGAGPGDPNLLTLAALNLLETADVVICDRLVSNEIRKLVKGELKVAQKYPGCADYAQMEIYRWIAQGLRDGQRVVRLKIGDPFIFGRGGEEVLEIERLTSGRITPTVVPGVSSVFAAPLLGGAPLTHRGFANNVVIGTGYGKNKSTPSIVPYQEQTTNVYLMAIGRIRQLSKALKENGYPENLPVVIIEKASCSDQRVILADLNDAADLVEMYKVKPPATIVVGESARALFPSETYAHGVVGYEAMPITSHYELDQTRMTNTIGPR